VRLSERCVWESIQSSSLPPSPAPVLSCDAQYYCDNTLDKAAAERSQIFVMGWFADPVFLGDYPEEMRKTVGKR